LTLIGGGGSFKEIKLPYWVTIFSAWIISRETWPNYAMIEIIQAEKKDKQESRLVSLKFLN